MNGPLKWYGGKSHLAAWIHSLAPTGYTHRNIVFGGGLGEFWNWLPIDGISEAVNDTNGDLVNFYKVLAEDKDSLIAILNCTLFAQRVFESSLEDILCGKPLVRAVKFFIKIRQSRMGLGKDFATPTTRIRRGMNENVSAWLSAVDGLPETHERLRRVEIRNLDYSEFISKYDHDKALFYCDPPYLASTRQSTGQYGSNEMPEEQHLVLLSQLRSISGKFMLSGYRSDLYDEYAWLNSWKRHEKVVDNHASSAKIKERKTECLWCNY